MAQVLNEFKKNLIQFFDSLIEQFPEESNFVLFRILVKDQIPPETIMGYIVQNVLPHKNEIKNRNEKFFTELNTLQFGLNTDQIGGIKKLWLEGKFDEEDKEIMWQWVDSFIILAERYQKTLNN